MLFLLIMYKSAGDFENVVGLFAVRAFRIVVDEGVVLVDNHSEAFFLLFVDTLAGFLISCFQDNHLKLFLIFCVRIVFQSVLGNDDCALVVVAEIVSEVVVELCIVDFLLHQLVLQLEDGVLCDSRLVAVREIVEKLLKLFNSLVGFCRAVVPANRGSSRILHRSVSARRISLSGSGCSRS